MRNVIMALLLAGIATPAVAAGAQPDFAVDPRDERYVPAEQAERQESAGRAERRQMRIERAQSQALAAERQMRSRHRAGPERGSFSSSAGAADPSPAHLGRNRPEAFDSVRDWRATERRRADSPAVVQERNLRRGRPDMAPGGFVEQLRPIPPVLDRNRPRVISETPVLGAEPPPPRTARTAHARPDRDWRTDWRRDRRFDWYDHRRRHRSLFHLGFYRDPFGWNYHRYGIGWRLWPSYYSSRFWLHDPWEYRLPRAYGPYRWVRYWDDALLVNLYTGQVVDVIHDFFW